MTSWTVFFEESLLKSIENMDKDKYSYWKHKRCLFVRSNAMLLMDWHFTLLLFNKSFGSLYSNVGKFCFVVILFLFLISSATFTTYVFSFECSWFLVVKALCKYSAVVQPNKNRNKYNRKKRSAKDKPETHRHPHLSIVPLQWSRRPIISSSRIKTITFIPFLTHGDFLGSGIEFIFTR